MKHELHLGKVAVDISSAAIPGGEWRRFVSPLSPDSEASDISARRLWWFGLPLLLVIALYILPLAGASGESNPNEVVRIELAASIAFWAQFDLGNTAAVYGLSEDVSVRDGKLYSDKAPGLSMVSAPFVWIVNPLVGRAPSSDLPAYWPLRHALTLLLLALPCVGLAFFLAAVVPGFHSNQRPAVALIVALSTPLWTYGTIFFGHVLAALLITVAWFLLIGFPGGAPKPGVLRAALGGTSAGFAVASEYPTAILVTVIFVTLVVRRTDLPVLSAAAAGTLAGTLPALVYHQVAFGAPWVTGYSFKAAADFQAIIAHGAFGISWPSAEALWGILFSARRGLFFFCPILLFVPVGLRSMVKKEGWHEAGPLLAAFTAYVLFASGFIDWPAGWCAAARHLVPILPLAVAVTLVAATKMAGYRWGAAIFSALLMISSINALLSIALTPFFPPEFGAPLAQLVLPSLADGAGFPNLLSSGLGIAPTVVVALIGVILIAAVIWATGRLFHDSVIWRSVIPLMTVAVLLLVYSWQGSTPKVETELMRSQLLRRLGHNAVADQIERTLLKAEIPGRD